MTAVNNTAGLPRVRALQVLLHLVKATSSNEALDAKFAKSGILKGSPLYRKS
ncbi:MAG TPA: hypothetical protein V6D20_19810 [Candidatus Obscuribacterales bacterium]